MALTTIQVNVIDGMISAAAQELKLMAKFNEITKYYANENMGTLTDADIQSVSTFAHITASELQAAKVAMDALYTTLGNYAANSTSEKFSKLTNNLPTT